MDVSQLMFRPGLMDGERILVTGASGAVGRSTCELLSARGHRVAGIRSRSPGSLTEGQSRESSRSVR